MHLYFVKALLCRLLLAGTVARQQDCAGQAEDVPDGHGESPTRILGPAAVMLLRRFRIDLCTLTYEAVRF